MRALLQPAPGLRAVRPPALLPKLCGADLELGNFILGLERPYGTSYEASRRLLWEIEGYASEPRPMRYGSLGSEYGGRSAETGGSGYAGSGGDGYSSQDWGRRFLPNGACFYIDLNHLEACIPEVLGAYDHVAWCHAVYRLAQRAADAANLRLPEGRRIQVLANNTDGDNSWGSHLSFLITRAAWEDLFHRRMHRLLYLASFQAASILFTGLGKVGAENGVPPVRYQISQRADYLEILTGLQTTYRRPVVNSRDEELCGAWRHSPPRDPLARHMARLHVIFYDHNLCHVAGFLKVGAMQLVLAMIEAGQIRTDLIVDDVVESVVRWSHDPFLTTRVRLVNGTEATAVELAWRFFEEARRFVATGRCEGVVPHAAEILRYWEETLSRLEARDWPALAPRLDWVLKMTLLEQALRERPQLDWASPEIKHLDHLYSSLDPREGLYRAYEAAGVVERLVPESRIEQCQQEPPDNTRAWTRGTLLRLARSHEVDAVDWDYVRFVLEPTRERPSYQYRTCHLDNPLAFGKGQAGTRLLGAGCLEEALDALGVPGSGNRYGDAAKSMALPAASASSEGAEPSSSPANLSDPKPSD